MTDKIPARFLVGEVLLQSLSIDAVCSFKTVLSFEETDQRSFEICRHIEDQSHEIPQNESII